MRENRIRAKLRSQRGASILFALLFFIVCAVIGSIVLTAGAAAAGRLADAEDMDQRYYAVTSAAKVLEAQLNDPAAVVTRTRSKNNADSDWSDWTVEPEAVVGETYSIPLLLRDALNSVAEAQKALKALDANTGVGAASDYELSVSLNHSGNSKLNATVKFVMESEGSKQGDVTIIVSDPESLYSLTLDCPAHVLSNTYYTGDTTEMEETITWSVASVKKGGAG